MIKTKTVFSRKEAKEWYYKEMRLLTYVKVLACIDELEPITKERCTVMLKNYLHKHISLEELVFEFEALNVVLCVQVPLLEIEYNKKHKYYIISYNTTEGFFEIR